jgi:diadenylate cyclase
VWSSLEAFGVNGLIQVLVLACTYYYLFLFFQGTRGAQVVVGFVVALAILVGLTQAFNLEALNWILRRISVFMGAALLIIFQPEIRRALAELGKQPVLSLAAEKITVVDHIVTAVRILAEHRVGALIAVEREIGTRAVQETGVRLEASVTPELLASLFYPHTPLHDGGVIIKGNRIVAAGCVFPVSQNVEIHRQVGTRHRAAVGFSEETDAVVVVVSEETGTISVGYRGRLIRGLDEERLKRFLATVLLKRSRRKGYWQRVRAQLDLTPAGIAKTEERGEQENSGGGQMGNA